MWTKINCIISSTTDKLVPLKSILQYQGFFFFFTIFKSQKAKNSSSTLPQISSLFYSYLSRQHTQPLNYSKQNLGVIVDTLFFPLHYPLNYLNHLLTLPSPLPWISYKAF